MEGTNNQRDFNKIFGICTAIKNKRAGTKNQRPNNERSQKMSAHQNFKPSCRLAKVSTNLRICSVQKKEQTEKISHENLT